MCVYVRVVLFSEVVFLLVFILAISQILSCFSCDFVIVVDRSGRQLK